MTDAEFDAIVAEVVTMGGKITHLWRMRAAVWALVAFGLGLQSGLNCLCRHPIF